MKEQVPSDFWCHVCDAWTPVVDDEDGKGFGCSLCGEDYECDECGSSINRAGECLNPVGCRQGGMGGRAEVSDG